MSILPQAPLQGDNRVPWNVQGKLFFSKANAALYFRTKACLAYGACVNSSSEFFAVTHNALDTMMIRFLQEAKLLAEDAIEDLNPYNNTRYGS
jgi:hypothetical protein